MGTREVGAVISQPPRPSSVTPTTALSTAATPTKAAKGRVTNVVPDDAARAVTTLVVGALSSGKSSLINGLLGSPGLAPVTGDPPPDPPRPISSAYLTIRHGESPGALAYLPGNRGPRPVGLDELRAGHLDGVVRGVQGRPPRRIEVRHSAELLRRLTLVDSPAVGFDRAYMDIALEVVDAGAELLFVTDAAAALDADELDFLAEVEQRRTPVTFVLTKIDAYPEWPAVLVANQNLVHTHTPALATSRWYAVSSTTGRANTGAPVAEAELGLSGIGLDALRRGLVEPPHRELPDSGRPAGIAKVVAVGTDSAWMRVLESTTRQRAIAAGQRVAIDLASIHVRCVQQIGSGAGCARLAYAFDHELHGLSARTTRMVDTFATGIIEAVFTEILESPPDAAAMARIRRATRRVIASGGDGDPPDWDRIMLVTATSAVAATSGHGAVASLAAAPPRPLTDALLPPFAIGLSAVCYGMWQQKAPDRKQCQGWLQQAIRVLEIDLQRELDERFDRLREALAMVGGDTVDHGVLLA
jgi:hypothetical protein